MDIEEAARSLHKKYQRFGWFTTVGIGDQRGQPCLYLYVKSLRHPELDALRAEGWSGFPVEIRRMGSPKAISRPLAS